MISFQVLRGHEFMLFFDLAQQQIARSQIYSLMAYMPFAFVAAHFSFAAHGRTKGPYLNDVYTGRGKGVTQMQT